MFRLCRHFARLLIVLAFVGWIAYPGWYNSGTPPGPKTTPIRQVPLDLTIPIGASGSGKQGGTAGC